MNDTVTKLMALVDEYAVERANWDSGHTSQTTPHLVDRARQAIEDELTRLFTPQDPAIVGLAIHDAEHGITGESK